MDKPLVTVIIPCYNAEQFIDRSIESVFMQDYPAVELIVVDDGSTDKSAEFIHAWEKVFSEKDGFAIKYYYQDNRGLGGAIDTGLKHVSGQYLSLLDADDRLLPNSISEKAEYLSTHPNCAIVRSNGYIVSGDNKWLFAYNETEKTGNLFELLMRGKTYNWAGSYMVRTSVLFDVYPERSIYPSRFGQNLQLMIPVSFKHECGYIDKNLMEYIQEDNSLSREADREKAKKKSIKNAEGFYDIRKHVIESLPFTAGEQIYWLKIAEGIYYRRLLQIAIEHDDKAMADKAIRDLRAIGELQIEDRIAYSMYKKDVSALFWRVTRRVEMASKKALGRRQRM